jgi:hypothetical protein
MIMDMPVDYVPCPAPRPHQAAIICTSYLSRATSDTEWHSGIALPDGRPYRNIRLLRSGPYAKKLKVYEIKQGILPGDPPGLKRAISFSLNASKPLGPCPPDIAKPCIFPRAVRFSVRYSKITK